MLVLNLTDNSWTEDIIYRLSRAAVSEDQTIVSNIIRDVSGRPAGELFDKLNYSAFNYTAKVENILWLTNSLRRYELGRHLANHILVGFIDYFYARQNLAGLEIVTGMFDFGLAEIADPEYAADTFTGTPRDYIWSLRDAAKVASVKYW